jgi:copper chaperone
MAEPILLKVPDMVCQGCADVVSEAVRQIAPQAAVTVDLASKRVQVTNGPDRASIEASIRASGYQVEPG